MKRTLILLVLLTLMSAFVLLEAGKVITYEVETFSDVPDGWRRYTPTGNYPTEGIGRLPLGLGEVQTNWDNISTWYLSDFALDAEHVNGQAVRSRIMFAGNRRLLVSPPIDLPVGSENDPYHEYYAVSFDLAMTPGNTPDDELIISENLKFGVLISTAPNWWTAEGRLAWWENENPLAPGTAISSELISASGTTITAQIPTSYEGQTIYIGFYNGADGWGENNTSFFVDNFSLFSFTFSAPKHVILLAPEYNSSIYDVFPTFSWIDDPTGGLADTYQFFLKQDNADFTNVSPLILTTNTYTPSEALARNSRYYWQVIPTNEDGTPDGPPSIFLFTTNHPGPMNTEYPYTYNFNWDSTEWARFFANGSTFEPVPGTNPPIGPFVGTGGTWTEPGFWNLSPWLLEENENEKALNFISNTTEYANNPQVVVSPRMAFPNQKPGDPQYYVMFDLALTSADSPLVSASLAPNMVFSVLGSDATDDVIQWTTAQQIARWAETSTIGVGTPLSQIPLTGTKIYVPIPAHYNGPCVRFAFYLENYSGSEADFSLFVDNFMISTLDLGNPATFTITPSLANFGNVNYGETPQTATQNFVITNNGTLPFNFKTISVEGVNVDQFAIAASTTLPRVLAPTDTMHVKVIFAPTSTGTKYANLVLKESVPAGRDFIYPLSGTGNYVANPIILNVPHGENFAVAPTGWKTYAPTANYPTTGTTPWTSSQLGSETALNWNATYPMTGASNWLLANFGQMASHPNGLSANVNIQGSNIRRLLVSPGINIPAVGLNTPSSNISFDLSLTDNENADQYEPIIATTLRFGVLISLDGITWNSDSRLAWWANSGAIAPGTTIDNTNIPRNGVNYSIGIPEQYNGQTVYLGFYAGNDGSNNNYNAFYVDNLVISSFPAPMEMNLDSGNGWVRADWSIPLPNPQFQHTGFRLYRGTNLVYSGTGTTYLDTGLANNTAYTYNLEATYSFNVGSTAYTGASARKSETISTPNSGEPMITPMLLTATIENELDVRLNWKAGAGSGITINHGINVTGSSPSGFDGAAGMNPTYFHRYTNTQLSQLGIIGGFLTHIRYRNSSTGTFTLKVYTGGHWIDDDRSKGTLVHEQLVTSHSTSAWNQIELTNPIEIPATGEIWFGYEQSNNPNSVSPMTYDNGIQTYSDIISYVYGGIEYIEYYEEFWGFEYSPNTDHNMIEGIVSTFADDPYTAPRIISQNTNLQNPTPSITRARLAVTSRNGNHSFISSDEHTDLFDNILDRNGRAITGYNIYRNENLINGTPIQAMTYLHSNVGAGEHNYVVRGVYADGGISAASNIATVRLGILPPTSLQALPGLKTVSLAWNIPAHDPGITLTGYKVYRNSNLITPTIITTNQYQDSMLLDNTTYSYYITAVYNGNIESEPSETVQATTDATELLLPVTNLSYNTQASNVTLNWEHGDIVPGTFTHHLNNNIGVEGGSSTGSLTAIGIQRFTVSQLLDLKVAGAKLTKIRFYAGSTLTSSVFRLRVYTGGSVIGTTITPGTMIIDQPITGVVGGAWNEYTLDSPVLITPYEELWFGYHCVTTAGDFPFATDSGPGYNYYGDVAWYNNTWGLIRTVLNQNWNYNWLIEGVAENNGVLINPINLSREQDNNLALPRVAYTGRSDFNSAEISPLSQTRFLSGSRSFTGYYVYRNGTLLTPTAISTKNYTDNNLPIGSYNYEVSALYTSGESSKQAIVVSIGFNAPRNFAVTPGPSSMTLSWEAPEPVPGFNVASYRIERDGVAIENSYTNTFFYQNFLPVGATYTYRVAAVYQEGFLGSFTTPLTATVLEGSVDTGFPPTNVTVALSPNSQNDVAVSWVAPTSGTGTFSYTTGANNLLSRGGQSWIRFASRYSVDRLVNTLRYAGQRITNVRFYSGGANYNYTISIYAGTIDAPGSYYGITHGATLLHTQSGTTTGQAEHNIALTAGSNVLVPIGQEMWIVIQTDLPATNATAVTANTGLVPMYSNLVWYNDSIGWIQVQDSWDLASGSLSMGFTVANPTMGSPTPLGNTLVIEPEIRYDVPNYPIFGSNTKVSEVLNAPIEDSIRSLLGYHIYRRNLSSETIYNKITVSPVSGLSFTDQNPPTGILQYGVSAVYSYVESSVTNAATGIAVGNIDLSVPFTENFDNAQSVFPPLGWSRVALGAATSGWTRSTTNQSAPASATSAAGTGSNNADNYLISPKIILGNEVDLNYVLTYSYRGGAATNSGSITVYASTTDTNVSSFTAELGTITPNSTTWNTANIILDAFKDQAIYLAFRSEIPGGTSTRSVFIDNIAVNKVITGDVPIDQALIPPIGFHGTPRPTSSVLVWENPQNPGTLVGYRLSFEGELISPLLPANSLAYEIELTEDKDYSASIYAVYTDRKTTAVSTILHRTVENLYPIENLVALSTSTGVVLTWQQTTSWEPIRSFVGYNVYRGTDLLNSSPISSLTYTDTTMEYGLVHTYRVVAVYDSEASEAISVAIQLPKYTISSPVADFGFVKIGALNQTRELTITNDGVGDLEIYNLQLVGSPVFSLVWGALTTPLTLATGENHIFGLSFTPVALQAYTAEVQISTNAQNQTVSVVGEAVDLFPVTSLNATYSSSSVVLTWVKPLTPEEPLLDGSDTLVGFYIRKNWEEVYRGSDPNLTTWTDSSVEPGEEYIYTVYGLYDEANITFSIGIDITIWLPLANVFTEADGNFGATPIETPKNIDLVATNIGGSQLTFTGISVTGTNASLFSIITELTGPIVLESGQSGIITLSAIPTIASTFTANLELQSNIGTIIVPLTVEGFALFSPTGFALNIIYTPNLGIALTHGGVYNSFSEPAPFVMGVNYYSGTTLLNTEPVSANPSQITPFIVSPVTMGTNYTYQAVAVYEGGYESPVVTQAVRIPNISISPSVVNMGEIYTTLPAGPFTVTITNTGGAGLVINDILSNNTRFTLEKPSLGVPLTANEAVTFTVNYTGETTVGTKNAVLTVQTNLGNQTLNATVTVILEEKLPVLGLNGKVNENDVDLAWYPGANVDPKWFSHNMAASTTTFYGSPTVTDAMYAWGQRYSPAHLASFGVAGGLLTQVSYYTGNETMNSQTPPGPYPAYTYHVAVYRAPSLIGQAVDGSSLVYFNEGLVPSAFNVWETHTLSEPVWVNPNEELIIGYWVSVPGPGGYPGPLAPGGVANYSLVNGGSGSWALDSNSNNYSLLIRGYVDLPGGTSAAFGAGIEQVGNKISLATTNQQLHPVPSYLSWENHYSWFTNIAESENYLAGNGTRVVQNYKIFRGNTLLSTQPERSYTDVNVANGKLEYRVIAVYETGDAAPATTYVYKGFTPPTAVSAAQVMNTTSIAVNWTAPTTSFPINRYQVYRNNTFVGTSTTTSYNDSQNIVNGQIYVYQITAVYNLDSYESVPSVASNQVNILIENIVPITDLEGSFYSDMVFLLWEHPQFETRGIQGFNVYRNNVKINTNLVTINEFEDDSSTNFVLGYHLYAVEAVYLNDVSVKVETNVMAQRILPPVNLVGIQVEGTNTARLTWQAPALLAGQPAQIIQYVIYRNGNPTPYTTVQASVLTFDDVNLASDQYRYTVSAIYNNVPDPLKESAKTPEIIVDIVVGAIDEPVALLTELQGNYPNPFNPETTIKFSVEKDTYVTLEIYNIKGQKVRTLVDGMVSAGQTEVIWKGTDDRGRSVTTGTYFYRMSAEGYSSMKRMTLLK